uniref:Baculoviral IAP repeat containing 2 n=1 Tax=Sander lucioperca TaxID=283035 RepID=A0A8C9X993_SANLU
MTGQEDCQDSFHPWTLSIITPDELAKAGFYFLGQGDRVCFCCDGGLRCWESGDDAWVEHAKWFPLCEYLLQEKGQEFVHQIQAHFPRLFEQVSREQHRNMLVVQIFKVLDQCRGPEKGGGARDAGAEKCRPTCWKMEINLFFFAEVPMEEQMWRLQEERTCMVCMDKEVNIVFIPCGHLVVCKECAPSLRKCPICRALVKGTVRTFLS